MKQIEVKAMAKVNLGLDVLRRRKDGYHEVRMIMQTVNLYDTLIFEETRRPGILIEADRPDIPTDGRNLIYKAAALLLDACSVQRGVRITLKKRIPMAAGMAGGSTDAAAAFTALNTLFSLGMDREEMNRLAVSIGADVPYCLMGGTALAEGIGEKLTPLRAAPECTLLIAKPPIEVSTKFVYENLHAERLEKHPDIDGMLEAIQEGSLQGVAKRLGNVLETVTERKYPVIGEIKEWMRQNGAMNALMSGSGPTVFGIYRDGASAERACRLLRETGLVQTAESAGLTDGNCMSAVG